MRIKSSLMEQPRDSKTASISADPTPAPLIAHARFRIGDMVRHKMFGFRGLVFDIDPVFANTEEWYEAIPAAMRPAPARSSSNADSIGACAPS